MVVCSIPKRYIVVILCFFGLFNAYAMRMNLSVAIVAMVSFTENAFENTTANVAECPALMVHTEKPARENLKGETYNWDATTQGHILSAFFYGYFIAMLPGGYFAKKVGAARLFGLSLLSTSLLTLLTPVVVRWGLIPFLVLRFLEGLGEAATFPAIIAIISRWAPKLERSRITSIIFSGAPVGNVFSFTISGLLSSSTFLGGWPSVFYVFGAIGCLWYLLWIFFIYDTPHLHPSISEEEILKYQDISYNENQKIPWKSIIISIPSMAAIISNFGHAFGLTIMNTEIPTYLSTILHFNIKSSGVLTSLPNIAEALGCLVSPFIADKWIASGKTGVTSIRKVFGSISGFGPAICLLVVAFSHCNSTLIMTMLTVGMCLVGFKDSGYPAAIVDMTPDYAGILFGISNGVANISGIIAPTMVGFIISNGVTIANWSKVFSITAGVYFFTTLAFALFASSEVQLWGRGEEETTKEMQ